MSPDERQIRELVPTWMSATKQGDLATVLTLMTDDVVFLVVGKEPFGKQQFAAAMTPHAAGVPMPAFDGHSDIQEVQIAGDFAYMWSKLSVDVTMPDGNV